jgi:hypothetical protein
MAQHHNCNITLGQASYTNVRKPRKKFYRVCGLSSYAGVTETSRLFGHTQVARNYKKQGYVKLGA